MSAKPAKFTFDLDLGRRAEQGSVLTDSALAARLDQARREGHAAGLAEGERAALARATRQLAQAAEAIGNQVSAMAAGIDDARLAAIAEATTLATAVGRKLARALIEREPAAEIAELVADCLSSLNGVPHLVIRCAPDLADAVRDLATQRMQTSGFTGRLVVMGDPEIHMGDARIEWADGGVVRDTAVVDAEIDQKIADYFAARGIVAPANLEPYR